MRIEEFDALDAEAAAEVLRPCVAIGSWVDALVAGRPYDDAAALHAAAAAQAATWTDAEVERALADHPRIGERHQGAGTSAAMSRSEQAGVPQDADVQARLADGNRRYEERFDRIYLVRAAGRSADEMLVLLEERLANDDATERAVTRGQLAEIAVLRLQGAVT
ncbi:2-oxo-4-hydroxy-4-carboxy-5-ureidoimidazoline decarboxylase [Nocardioides lianchengensis]|uniref:2-oxo-4-hydroxy-4-carboxy-5-ureidoimidazoline decarboxylase n=1 Tax=Nocardioides lianchengensis TaxID=1045774 RepID=A0A1G6UZD0_9ACTN|nr:2-oxo-4-hydroxy-4-carboxy-5-ureidoimidazoline decarboxylase [Nocardioides lianchengensis]NYG11087.1 2-oxo-4-hydroxy-4-carboxy-5-ureidoimidazoline decarboxylase [Nocardioides lianchengensis]SDD46699.1 2-oxo-4-hydroxy-4-carboxy-5-ureidoimidazoline decarboxylase [Nocardioides lianchengensis]